MSSSGAHTPKIEISEKLKNDIQCATQYLNQNPKGDPVKMGKRKGKNK